MTTATLNVTEAQKIDFINKCVRKNGKAIPKSQIKEWPKEKVNELCERFAKDFKNFIDNPPVKLVKFWADVKDKEGKGLLLEGKYENLDEFSESLAKDGYKVLKIVPAKGHHICMYCNGIAEGTQKDLLCEDCRDTFGHYSYNEL